MAEESLLTLNKKQVLVLPLRSLQSHGEQASEHKSCETGRSDTCSSYERRSGLCEITQVRDEWQNENKIFLQPFCLQP